MIECSSVFQPVLETAKDGIYENGKFLFCWERFLFRLKGIHRWEVNIDVLWLHQPPLASADSIDGGTVSAHYITVQPLSAEHIHKRCPVGTFELLKAGRLLDTPGLGIVQKVDHLNSFNGF